MKRGVFLGLVLLGCGGTDSTSDAGPLSCTDTWATYAQGFFADNCERCHGQFSQASVSATRSSISSQLSSGRMPTDRSLSANERTRILTWLTCGTK